MIRVLVHDGQTIVRDAVYSSFEACGVWPGEHKIEEADESVTGFTHYWDGEQFTLKQPIPYEILNVSIAADGIDEAVVSGLPEGTVVLWPDEEITVEDDGQFEYSVNYPGSYVFRLGHPIYLAKEITIEAVA